MPNNRWHGKAQAIAQVHTIAVSGTWAANDTATLTCNGKDLVLTAGTDVTTTAIATALKEMINGDTQTGTGDHDFSTTGNLIEEWGEITATVSGSTLILTAATAGRPFTVTRSESTAGSGALGAVTEVTASAGPEHWDTTENWSAGTIPANSEDVLIDQGDAKIRWGLSQAAVALSSLTITSGFRGEIGLPEINEDGLYYEYRTQRLTIGATTLNIGGGIGPGSGRLRFDLRGAVTAVNVNGTGQPAEQERSAVMLSGDNTCTAVNVTKGSVGLCEIGTETWTVTTLRTGYQQNVQGDSQVYCGGGLALTNLDQSGGEVELNCATTTVDMTDGELNVNSSAHASVDLWGGVVNYRSTGTITGCIVGGEGFLNFGQDMRPRTITNALQLHRGARVDDPFGTVTLTAGFELMGGATELDVEVNFGPNHTHALS